MQKIFRSNISGTPGISIYDLRSLAQNEPAAFVSKIEAGVNDGHFKLSEMRDMRALYHALADVSVPITIEVAGAQRSHGDPGHCRHQRGIQCGASHRWAACY